MRLWCFECYSCYLCVCSLFVWATFLISCPSRTLKMKTPSLLTVSGRQGIAPLRSDSQVNGASTHTYCKMCINRNTDESVQGGCFQVCTVSVCVRDLETPSCCQMRLLALPDSAWLAHVRIPCVSVCVAAGRTAGCEHESHPASPQQPCPHRLGLMRQLPS